MAVSSAQNFARQSVNVYEGVGWGEFISDSTENILRLQRSVPLKTNKVRQKAKGVAGEESADVLERKKKRRSEKKNKK